MSRLYGKKKEKKWIKSKQHFFPRISGKHNILTWDFFIFVARRDTFDHFKFTWIMNLFMDSSYHKYQDIFYINEYINIGFMFKSLNLA